MAKKIRDSVPCGLFVCVRYSGVGLRGNKNIKPTGGSVKNLQLNMQKRSGSAHLSSDIVSIFQGTLFSSVLFDETVGAEEVAERLPGILSEFEEKNHVRITSVTPLSFNARSAFLLRHTAPQKGDSTLM